MGSEVKLQEKLVLKTAFYAMLLLVSLLLIKRLSYKRGLWSHMISKPTRTPDSSYLLNVDSGPDFSDPHSGFRLHILTIYVMLIVAKNTSLMIEDISWFDIKYI